MEKESDKDIKPTNDVEESNHPKPDTDDTTAEPLYYTKDGKPQFGITPPTAFALNCAYPPLPSNLAKNRVLRVYDEQTKESVQQGITEAEKEFEKDAMPFPSLTIHGSPLSKVLIPEIELALYWDRHPYEFRIPEKDRERDSGANRTKSNSPRTIRRSKSEMNLASKVGKLLEEHNISGSSRKGSDRSSVSASNKTTRSSTVTTASSVKSLSREKSTELSSPKNNHYGEHLTFPSKCNGSADNGHNEIRCTNGRCGSGAGSKNSSAVDGNRIFGGESAGNRNGKAHVSSEKYNSGASANQLQLSENERKKFDDIKLFHHHQGDRESYGQGSHSRQPKLIRSHDQMEHQVKKSAGVQVTIDDVAAAALKSTYLCPLHGQYRRGIERRDKGGFRTDMGSINNVHAHCSRALKGKPSRTKMIKSAETQTDGDTPGSFQNIDKTSKRSRTAGHNARNSHKDIMASEYHGSFKNPYKIAESEKRHLRNKILNYCFTKHSIF